MQKHIGFCCVSLRKFQLMSQVKPYEAGGSKKEQVSRMFDRIARKYDLLNHILSLGIDIWWRKKAISQLKPHRPVRLLDVATGTADLAIEAARQLQPQSIVGIDISKEMLAIGRQKVAQKGLSQLIELRLGDSEALPFADNSFDAVTVAFGVRNFEHLEVGLREMARVLRPGGQIVILEFSKPRLFPFKQLYHFYFRNLLPFIGRMTSKDPKAYDYLYRSVMAFPDGANFEEILKKTGYANPKTISLTLGICAIYTARRAH